MALNDVFSYYPSGEPYATQAWRSGRWRWATQGHLLVAIADDEPADPAPERFGKALHYLDDAPPSLTDVPLTALRRFAGRVLPAHVDCEMCDGDGYDSNGELVKCEHCEKSTRPTCGHCGGDGAETMQPRYGRVAGTVINRVLLAFALAQVPQDEVVQIGLLPSVGTLPLVPLAVLGKQWRIVLMCCKDVGEVQEFDPALAQTTSR